jgi:hypothetical protein
VSLPRALAALAAAGGLLLTSHVLPASAAPATGGDAAAAPAGLRVGPPVGRAWLVGVVTDQAGHPLDGVNVEAWSTDPAATAPVASGLTYESTRNDGQHGFFNLEVPIHADYVVVFSRPSGDVRDAFHTSEYDGGDPITVGLRKERELGTTELVHEGQVASRAAAALKPGSVKPGRTAKLTVTVTSRFVAPVIGKVTVTLGGAKVTKKPVALRGGKLALTLTAPRKPGKYSVVATFAGSGTVQRSDGRTTLTVKR